MTEQADGRAKLSVLLECHQDDVASAWSGAIQALLGAGPEQALSSSIPTVARLGMDAHIELLDTASPEVLDPFVDRLEQHLPEAGSDPYSAVEALLLLKTAVLPLIQETHANDPSEAFALIEALDALVATTIRRFASRRLQRWPELRQAEREQPGFMITASESLQRVTTAVLERLVGVDEVLRIVCTEARHLTGATGSAVLLWEDEGLLRVMNSSGAPSPALELLPASDSFAGRVIEKGEPLLLNEPYRQRQAYNRNPDVQTLLATPLRTQNRSIGAIDVVNKEGGFTNDDIHIMSLFAGQAAIAIENARLHERAEQLAVVEERQRLARELHDSVTQAIYSVNLYAEAARMALSAGKTKVAAENLNELRSMAREATLDMRMLIFELHQPAWEEEGLASALQARLEAVEARSGLHTEFQARGEKRLPLSVEEELYRIAQEALNNAVKHARAQKVIIRLHADHDLLRMEVQDNGSGFDLAEASESGGLGLQSIEERVQRVNGELTIESVAGEGTTLRVEVKAP